jgi:DHA1 family bicyclomycin/chloramphenicol resistance-like MFS transporter
MSAVMLGAWACALAVLALATPAYRRGGWTQLA